MKGLGPYAPQGSRKLRKWSRRSKSVLQSFWIQWNFRRPCTYSRSTGEVNSNRVTSSLLRKWTWLPTHAYEVGALTLEVTDNYGSNDVLPCDAYRPCTAYRASFRHIPKRKWQLAVHPLFAIASAFNISISKENSAISLEEWVLVFKVFTTATGTLRVKHRHGGRNSSLVVFGLAVHSVAGSILLWGNFPVEGIFPLELTWDQTPFPQKLFRMRV